MEARSRGRGADTAEEAHPRNRFQTVGARAAVPGDSTRSFAAVGAWFAIVFTGRDPRWNCVYVEGLIAVTTGVVGYALIFVADVYTRSRLHA